MEFPIQLFLASGKYLSTIGPPVFLMKLSAARIYFHRSYDSIGKGTIVVWRPSPVPAAERTR